MNRNSLIRWSLTSVGVGVLIYALLVHGYAATAPDVGLRFLLVETDAEFGPVIRAVLPHLKSRGQSSPQVGDRLVGFGMSTESRELFQPTGTFIQYTRALARLRGDVPFDGVLPPGANPSELSSANLIPHFVEIDDDNWLDRDRWVEVQLKRAGNPELIRTWLQVTSLPWSELGLPLLWFVLEVGIFSVGAAAYWTRPFDRSARVFFGMCIVTVGAFVGGYHWWLIAGNLWLNIPFAMCAVLVPVVTLHFFLIFPQPIMPLTRHPLLTMLGLYLIPIVAILAFITILGYCRWLSGNAASSPELSLALQWLRRCIQAYLLFAGLAFGATLAALLQHAFTTGNPMQQQQVKWILWAALIATLPVGYTLYLTQFDRVGFATGRGTFPMFLASLLFMLAYAVAIARYKLMLVDQLFSRETLYVGVGVAITAVYSALIAVASLVAIFQHIRSIRQAFVVSGILMLSISLLGWLRSRIQRLIDRRFFREKYQLDKALQQMNQMSGQLEDPTLLAERMLASCRDVLLVTRAALFVHDAEQHLFLLVEQQGDRKLPPQFPALPELMQLLESEHAIQRLRGSPREQLAAPQLLLEEINADLVQALEVNGVVEGLVVLGEKRSGSDYTAEDLTFLTAMGQVASVAMHSAKVHQLVARLNDELQNKVSKIEEQQRQISVLQSEIITTQRQGLPKPVEADGETPAESVFRNENIRGKSPTMQRLLETVRKVASSEASVLVRGESGTGKELLAEAIHHNSQRRNGPLVKVHCGALSAGLLESELFGHVKGAFTGAHRDKVGRFELANTGTLFLDEIGDISLETQIKLLRVLQEREFEPVGSTRTTQVDVRLITATHQNLERLIAEGKFREDLFYRLNVISITPPPLRERLDDLFELALHFMTLSAHKLGKTMSEIAPEAIDALQRHSWPGNIRELENVIERAVVLAETSRLTLADLPPEIRTAIGATGSGTRPYAGRAVSSRLASAAGGLAAEFSPDPLEREKLLGALRNAGGNKALAARQLGLPRSTFFSKLKRAGLDT